VNCLDKYKKTPPLFDQSPQKMVFKKVGWTVAGLPLDYCNILQ
jgi:hypothetical protein